MKANVKREGDKVWIEGVKGWHMGERGSSVHAAQATVMKVAGQDVTYEDLVGASALAFRMQVHETLCPSSPHPFCGRQCVAGSNRALPWRFRVFEVRPDDTKGVKEARAAVVASIDRGIPAVYGNEEDGVIVGYQKGGQEWLCLHPLSQGGRKVFVEKGWPWGVAVFTGPVKSRPGRPDLALGALKQAAAMARETCAPDKKYLLGVNAWNHWIRTVEGLRDDDSEALKAAMMGNSWIYTTLVEYRTVAAAYLRSVAPEFKAPAAEHLRTAADHYDRMAKEVLVSEGKCALDVAPTPWYLKKGEEWTADMRRDQVRRLKAALPLEQQAIAEIEKALAAEGVEVGDAGGAKPSSARGETGKEVLLKEAVKAFDEVIGGTGEGHAVAAGRLVYVQPPVYLTTHVIEMRAAGWKEADYDTEAAVSGTSALFGYDPRDFGPKYAHLTIGPDKRIAEAAGFGYEWLKFSSAEEAWKIIRSSLDAGKPVKGWHYENCLFVGYRDAARPADRQLYVVGDGPGTFSKWWTWEAFIEWVGMMKGWKQTSLGRHTERVDAADLKTVALRVMKDLVAWSRTPPPVCRKRWPKAVWGIPAIEAYAADVADLAKKPKEHFKDTAWCACHGINGQWTARNSTGVYLEGVAGSGVFPETVNAHLLAAAKQYRAAFAAWQTFCARLGHTAPEDAWLDEARRAAGAAAVSEWLRCETAAIAEVAAALKTLGVAPAAEPGEPGSH